MDSRFNFIQNGSAFFKTIQLYLKATLIQLNGPIAEEEKILHINTGFLIKLYFNYVHKNRCISFYVTGNNDKIFPTFNSLFSVREKRLFF
jgi:hypothetical protein